jgi:hypothetical protein
MQASSPLEAVGMRWEQQVLDDELQQLPESMREPLILHELQGRSCAEIAASMDLSVSAVEGRLKRGRKELKHRLLRRGVGLGGVLVAVQSLQAETLAAAPALISHTARAALALSAGKAAAAIESIEAASLAQQELLAMTAAKTTTALTLTGSLIIAGGLLGTGLLATQLEAGRSLGNHISTLVQSDSGTVSISGSGSGAIALANSEPTGDERRQDTDSRTGFEAMEDVVSLHYANQKLSAVVDEIARQHHVQVGLDSSALRRMGERPDSTVSIQADGIKLRSALELMLSPLGLQAFPEKAGIAITDAQGADVGGSVRSIEGASATAEDQWNDPRNAALDYMASSRSRQKIEEALSEPVDLEFIDTELGQAVQYLSDRYQIPILPDEAELTEFGVGLDTPINLVISGISLESAFNLMLRDHDLDYVIEDEVLQITTREVAEQTMETRVYELRRLPDEFKPEDIARVIIRNIAPASWGNNAWVYVEPVTQPGMEGMMEGYGEYLSPDGGGQGAGGYGAEMAEGATPPRQKPVKADAPTAAIETLPGLLVITQSQRRHREISDLLQQLHRVPTKADAAPAGILTPIPKN